MRDASMTERTSRPQGVGSLATRRLSALLLIVACLSLLPGAPGARSAGSLMLISQARADTRQSAQHNPAEWQDAVLKLRIPVSRIVNGYRAHSVEDCTGTLIDTAPKRILTAWHCFDGYDDLTNPATFRLGNQWHELRLLGAGGSMHSDWALLEVDQSLVAALPALTTLKTPLNMAEPITMAGFSGDDGLGASGEQLTFDSTCQVDQRDEHRIYSHCTAYKGASGGPVLVGPASAPQVAGIISGRQPNGLTLFIPVQRVPGLTHKR